MKKLVLLFAIALFAISCTPQTSTAKDSTIKSEIKPEKNEDGEWDLEVLDTDFNYFMNTIARPMNMYSESYQIGRASCRERV